MATMNEALNPRPSRKIQFWSFVLPVGSNTEMLRPASGSERRCR